MRHLIGRLRSRSGAFAHDLLMIPSAWLGAYWLRFNLEAIPEPILAQALAVVPVMVCVQGGVFWYFGLYRGVWRFASLPDLLRILRAVVVGVALCAVAIFLLTRMQDVPRSVFPLHGLLLILLLGGPRLVYRWSKERRSSDAFGSKVLIVGAGVAGEALVRELRRDTSHRYTPVGFVDDDTTQRGREIHGVRVIGKCGSIPRLTRERGIELVLLAIPSATSREMRRLVALCERAQVPFRTLPQAAEIHGGESTLRQLREVSIEDLLGREVVHLDWEAIASAVTAQAVLVSGGGGSIGSELCRQMAKLGPARLVVLDNSEYNLYAIDHELRGRFPDLAIVTVLADVCDAVAIERCFERERPSVVFHAAAYKHVPLLEGQARQAVRNNVLGTRNVALAAARHGAGTMVLISTDKAVNPTNVMGASKRVAELLCQNFDARHSATRYITVRFGNVLDSAGSVVPLFRRQIASGGPVTVTHPEIKRYFMTISEACQLILQAAAIGNGGEIYVLDMGEPVRIQYLAEQMILLAGKKPGQDVDIVHTGLRPGEKLFEELFHHEERSSPTGSAKIFLARSRRVPWERLEQGIDGLAAAVDEFDEARLRARLADLVPEYAPASQALPSNVVPIGPRGGAVQPGA